MAGDSLKAAPRREVKSITKKGDWGEVIYLHLLSCGHTEIRKRQSPATHIACSGCVTAKEFARSGPTGLLEVSEGQQGQDFDDLVVEDQFASAEADASRLRAGIAKTFGIPVDAVDVALTAQAGVPEVAYVLVFLDAQTARRLSNDLTKSQ